MSVKVVMVETDRDKLEELFNVVLKAATGLPFTTEMSRIRDADKIKKLNVKKTPVLVVNDKVKASGRIPQKEEIREWLIEEYNSA